MNHNCISLRSIRKAILKLHNHFLVMLQSNAVFSEFQQILSYCINCDVNLHLRLVLDYCTYLDLFLAYCFNIWTTVCLRLLLCLSVTGVQPGPVWKWQRGAVAAWPNAWLSLPPRESRHQHWPAGRSPCRPWQREGHGFPGTPVWHQGQRECPGGQDDTQCVCIWVCVCVRVHVCFLSFFCLMCLSSWIMSSKCPCSAQFPDCTV